MIEKRVNETVIKVATAVNQAVVLATPVDTGRARGNWQVGINSSPTGETGKKDKPGQATISANNSVISGRGAGQTINIANNVVYIGRLNAGSSAQAPAGFVATAVIEGAAVVKGARVLR